MKLMFYQDRYYERYLLTPTALRDHNTGALQTGSRPLQQPGWDFSATWMISTILINHIDCAIVIKQGLGSAVHFLCYWSLIARFMGRTWSPSGADRTLVGPMLAPWTMWGVCLLKEITFYGGLWRQINHIFAQITRRNHLYLRSPTTRIR